ARQTAAPRIAAPVVAPPRAMPSPAPISLTGAAPAAAPEPTGAPSDTRGTRRAARIRIDPPLEIMVDGNLATLLDLSAIGAQVVSPAALKPNQRVRLVLADEQGSIRLIASVAWASF